MSILFFSHKITISVNNLLVNFELIFSLNIIYGTQKICYFLEYPHSRTCNLSLICGEINAPAISDAMTE